MKNDELSEMIWVFAWLSVGVAVMHLQSPPVNSLSLDLLTEFCISLEKLEMDKGCRGLIITSVRCGLVISPFCASNWDICSCFDPGTAGGLKPVCDYYSFYGEGGGIKYFLPLLFNMRAVLEES